MPMAAIPFETVMVADEKIFTMGCVSVEDAWDMYVDMLEGFGWGRGMYEDEVLRRVDGSW